MKGDGRMGDWNAAWKTVIAVAFIAVAAGFLLPLWTNSRPCGPLTRNLSTAKQVFLAVRMYAEDNKGKLPEKLEDIMPKYCTTDAVLWSTGGDGKTKVRWQYFPNHKFGEEPRAIILSSLPNPDGYRVIGFTDESVNIVPSEEFKKNGKATP